MFGRLAKGAIFGGATIAAPALQGHVGASPLSMTARSIDVAVAKPGFSISGLAVRLGDANAPTRFDADSLDGHVDVSGMSGHMVGAAGKIGAVPLVLSKGEGNWRLASGILTAHAGLRLADAETAAPRFLPMRSDNVVLTLANKRITATAMLKEPASGRTAGGVTIHHDLASGRGDATLDVPDLTFDKGLQPEQLTPYPVGGRQGDERRSVPHRWQRSGGGIRPRDGDQGRDPLHRSARAGIGARSGGADRRAQSRHRRD
jgi:hypothetical protein